MNLVTFYRPPGEADLVNLADLLTVNDWKHPVMLIGDFNLSDINWSRNKGEIKPSSNRKSFHREALDLFATANLVQFVSGSTHVKGNTLDLLFVEKDLLNDIVVEWEIKPGISDHNMILVGVDLQQYQQCGVKYSGKRTRYNYKKADYVKICEVFRDLNDMAHQNKFSTPGEIWDALKSAIMTCLEKYVPTSLTQPGGKPWMTRTLIRLIRKRDRVYQRYRQYPTQENANLLHSLKQSVKQQVNKAKQDYLDFHVTEQLEGGNNKPLYNLIRASRGQANTITSLEGAEPEEIPNFFADFFSSVYSSCRLSTPTFEPSMPIPTAMPNFQVTVSGVSELVDRLDNRKASCILHQGV